MDELKVSIHDKCVLSIENAKGYKGTISWSICRDESVIKMVWLQLYKKQNGQNISGSIAKDWDDNSKGKHSDTERNQD